MMKQGKLDERLFELKRNVIKALFVIHFYVVINNVFHFIKFSMKLKYFKHLNR